jgi:hypothetical protein
MILRLLPDEEVTCADLLARAKDHGHHTDDHAVRLGLTHLTRIGRLTKRAQTSPGDYRIFYRRVSTV